MSASEILGRVRDRALQFCWRHQPPDVHKRARSSRVTGAAVKLMPLPTSSEFSDIARYRLIRSADQVLRGEWLVFGRLHPNMGTTQDWFVDARGGQQAPRDAYSFDISHRDEECVGNIKYIWEPSRHHHLTLLASAYAVSGDVRYAERVAVHLKSWWRENPFLKGPHWISGIEIAIRLISWVWIRQLLARWPGASSLFEDNAEFRAQLYGHQLWLESFPSRGSSANNHVIAEAAGQFAASCVFPLFGESGKWRLGAAEILRVQAPAQTFACGVNRELATDYHAFVLELLLVALVQGEAAGHALDADVWRVACRMTDVIAVMLDTAGHPPRQGDADDGIGLLLDAPDYDRWNSLLATGAALFAPLPWWPAVRDEDVRSVYLASCIQRRAMAMARPETRPALMPEAGQIFLRAGDVWCRGDHGPHGLGTIAAHAHADALSLEYRIRGTEILADPGTYCYHGEKEWRDYFRSTFAHNTLQMVGRDQSVSGGPFLWTHHAQSRLVTATGLDDHMLPVASWLAEHSGYLRDTGLVHRRRVSLRRADGHLLVQDVAAGGDGERVSVRLSWHLGPEVDCTLSGASARLAWPGGEADMKLPADLEWSLWKGSERPIAGWYSASFDRKCPAITLVGDGNLAVGQTLVTELQPTASPTGSPAA